MKLRSWVMLHVTGPKETLTSDGDVTRGKLVTVSNTLRPSTALVFPDKVAVLGVTLASTGALKY